MTKTKIKRRPFPKCKGFVFKAPGLYYFGGALHYIDKSGKVKHSNELKVPKSEIMTKTEFKKRFYDPEKVLKLS